VTVPETEETELELDPRAKMSLASVKATLARMPEDHLPGRLDAPTALYTSFP
jgi:hypothetical protein